MVGVRPDGSGGNASAPRRRSARSAYGHRIDILLNVAGRLGTDRQDGRRDDARAEFDEIVTLNMNGCFHAIRAVLPAR